MITITFGKKAQQILIVAMAISILLAIVSFFCLNSINSKSNDNLENLNGKIRFSNLILDNIHTSSNSIKDMMMSADASYRLNLQSRINTINSTVILFGDSLRAKLIDTQELEMYNAYLEAQKKFLTSLISINNNLNAGNHAGAFKLNITEFKSANDTLITKTKAFIELYQTELIEKVSSITSYANFAKTLQIILIFISLCSGALLYFIKKADDKAKAQLNAASKINTEDLNTNN